MQRWEVGKEMVCGWLLGKLEQKQARTKILSRWVLPAKGYKTIKSFFKNGS